MCVSRRFSIFWDRWAQIMFRTRVGLLLSCCCAWLPLGAAEPPSRPLSPLPATGFRFDGSWDCTGSFRNAQLHKAAFTGTMILDGTWLELAEQDVTPATGYSAMYLIGYDPQAKHLVEFDANNFGAATYTSNEQGWRNGILTMSSAVSTDHSAPYAANRFVYTVVDQDTFTVDWEISKTSTINWVRSDHLNCVRIVQK
jgi:hypothetical protein